MIFIFDCDLSWTVLAQGGGGGGHIDLTAVSSVRDVSKSPENAIFVPTKPHYFK